MMGNRFANKLHQWLCMAVMATALAFAVAPAAYADPESGTTSVNGANVEFKDLSCTNFEKLKEKSQDGEKGLLTNITDMIKDVIGGASEKLFKSFTGNKQYKAAVYAAVTLMITIYGVSFMIGVVQPSFGQALIRLFKIGIIFALISPTGWTFFSQYVVRFFNDGTDELIRGVMSIGTGQTIAPGDSPFKQLDVIAKWIISPDIIIAVMGTIVSSGPYGLAMGGLLAFAVGGVIKMLLEGLKTYALTFILRSLLFGVAPIFFVFLLFEKTKSLFQGWLNSLVNLSLQPILYFTFLSFFLVMMTNAAYGMLGAQGDKKAIEFCWTEFTGINGSQNPLSYWRIKLPGQNAPSPDGFDWRGQLSCLVGGDPAKCKPFPINIIDLLSFLILVYIATRFADVTQQLASEISNAFVNLDTQAKMEFANKNGQAPASTNKGGAVQTP